MNKIYAIFSGEYSDWAVHGFFETEEEANNYCLIKNQNDKYYSDNYYVEEIDKIDVNVKNIEQRPYYICKFRFNNNIQNYSFKIKKDFYYDESKEFIDTYGNFFSYWIEFSINTDSEEKAKKIAYDKYAKLLALYFENNNFELSAETLGVKFSYTTTID